MKLKVTPSLYILIFLIMVDNPGAFFLVVGGISRDFSIHAKVGPAFSFFSSLHAQFVVILVNWSTMGSHDNNWTHDEDMGENDFQERQLLAIRVSSHSSTILFA
jgi:hypothetical protein